MAILLNTPESFEQGHGEAPLQYALIQLIDFRVQIIQRTVTLVFQYGNLVDGGWVPGPKKKTVIRDKAAVTGSGVDPADGVFKVMEIEPANPAFTDLASLALMAVKAADAGERYLDVISRDLHQHFINQGYYEGVIV